MAFSWRSKDKYAPITIRRKTEAELKQAINDLVARGYILLRQGSYENEQKSYDYEQNINPRLNRFRYSDKFHYTRFYAVLKRSNFDDLKETS